MGIWGQGEISKITTFVFTLLFKFHESYAHVYWLSGDILFVSLALLIAELQALL
jgi:hypothetical protein